MEFSNRKSKCKKVQITDENGLAQTEAFYALIIDEVTQEGTPLNAENMNKISETGQTALTTGQAALELGQAASDTLNNLYDPTTGKKDYLTTILNNIFNLMAEPFTVAEYDALPLSVLVYDGKNIGAFDFDMHGKSLVI